MVGQEGFLSYLFTQFTFHLHLKSDFCDLVLSRQLIHSHHPAELETPIRHKLCTQNSIEHLMEVNVAIIDVDTHLENSSIDLFV